jgi:hypothetical protein
MTLQRAQIDVLLQDLEATAWRRHRADPRDPTLSRDIVDQARALLRVAAPGEHLHICDCAQHLLLSLDGEPHEPQHADVASPVAATRIDDASRADGILHAVRPTRECVPDLGIALVDDPYDLDAYVPKEAEATIVRMVPAPQPVRVFAPERRAAAEDGAEARELRRGLTAQQLRTLDTMSHFGWRLCFVRRPMFLSPVPVAFDRNRERFVVVEADGSIDDAPHLTLRD